MTSIFSLRCARCDGELIPAWGAVWTCSGCARTFEVCGRYLVPVSADGDRADPLPFRHRSDRHQEPVDAEGSAKTRERSSVTGQRASTSWSYTSR